jgi:predicted glycosyltransferase/nucleoside-diphosphate-sugar epimerase
MPHPSALSPQKEMAEVSRRAHAAAGTRLQLAGAAPHVGLVVVTGAAGFIGSTLSEALLAQGWQVRGIDAFTSTYHLDQKRANVARLADHPDFNLIEADLNTADLAGLLDGATAVAHLAGEAGVSTSWGAEFDSYVDRNVLATQRLLNAAVASSIRRFVYASSSSIYGDMAGEPVPESVAPHPASPYGVTKLAAEHLVRAYAAQQGFPAVVLRYFSVYGPRQRPDMAVHRFIEAALNGEALTIFGDGGQVRDFTYVDDVVRATMAAITADLEPGTVLNIAGGRPTRIGDVAALVGRLLDLPDLGTNHEPERPGDVGRTNGSLAAARKRLGWEPSIQLTVGVYNQIQWHLGERRIGSGSARRAPNSSGGGPRHSRLLIYTQDGLGLGHLRRAGSLAAEFLDGNAGGCVLTISDSPLGTFLRDTPRHDFLKLPSIVKAGPGDWHPLALNLTFPEVVELRSKIIAETASAFRPDVLLVDHMPHGAMGELVPTLDMLRDTPTRIVLGMRDIIDAPQVVRQRWQSEGALDALAEYYDRVLVYGSRDIFDVAQEYGWPSELADLIRYCGYVCAPDDPSHVKRIRARHLPRDSRHKLIVAMAGGGADAYPLMSTLLDAYPRIAAGCPCVLVVITGPFMADDLRQDLRIRSEGLSVRVRTTVRDPLSYIAAADLVISMAGYNTTAEMMRIGTPALLVPRRGPSSEQRMRAQRFADRGWVATLDPDELGAGRLARAALKVLGDDADARPATRPDFGGIRRAVDHLYAASLSAYVHGVEEFDALTVVPAQMTPAR